MAREFLVLSDGATRVRKLQIALWQSIALIFVCAAMTAMAPLAQAASAISTDTPVICNNTFALCTSAPCIPDPNDPEGTAICSCEVTKGANYGTSICGDRHLVKNRTGADQLVSTYALTQSPSKPVMSCESGALWTDCLDYPCVVDPQNPLKAICSCAIKTTGEFVTYGGDCNTRTCKDAYWSAAAPADFQSGTIALVQALGITSDPVTFCPPTKMEKQ